MSDFSDLKPNPQYAMARDLLNLVIALTLTLIREERSKSNPNVASLNDYEEECQTYHQERDRLHQLDDQGLVDAISRYREILDREYQNRKEN